MAEVVEHYHAGKRCYIPISRCDFYREKARADRAEATLARVRELHHPEPHGTTQVCATCDWDGQPISWPCETGTALGDEQPE